MSDTSLKYKHYSNEFFVSFDFCVILVCIVDLLQRQMI
jgi:hypothetical protein